MNKRALCHVCFSLILAVVLMVSCALPSLAKGGQDAGRVSAVQGDVKLSGEGASPRDVKAFDVVRVNDSFRVGQSSMVKIIFYSDYHEEMIKGKSLAAISRKSATIVEGSKDCLSVTRKPPISALPDNPSQNGRSIAAGVIKGETIIPRGTFNNGTETPLFSWEKAGEARYYRITINILKEDKSSDFISTVIEINSYAVPEAKKLAYGTRYALQVAGYENDPKDPAYQGMADNMIASNEDALYYFILPSKENLAFIDAEEKKLRSLKRESPEWNSSASLLLIACMEFGLVDKAGALAKEMISNGIQNDDISRIAFRYAPRSDKR
jgi:hypothetical protein